jgi:hypothetical protein
MFGYSGEVRNEATIIASCDSSCTCKLDILAASVKYVLLV